MPCSLGRQRTRALVALVAGLTLVTAPGTLTGFKGVYSNHGKAMPYKVEAWIAGNKEYLGTFATAAQVLHAAALLPTADPIE